MNPETFWLGFAMGRNSIANQEIIRDTVDPEYIKDMNERYAVIATQVLDLGDDHLAVMIIKREAPDGG